MKRQRAKAVLRTELPIKAGALADFESKVERAFRLLSNPHSCSFSRLAVIARTYHDGRRMEAQKIRRPDCRKSIEVLSQMCVALSELLKALPEDHRRLIGEMTRRELPGVESRSLLPSEIAQALEETAQIDLRKWQPNTPTALEPILVRFELLAAELADRFMHLPQDAEWLFIELQQHLSFLSEGRPDSEFLPRLIGTAGKLAHAAAELMKSDRGPQGDTVQMRAVQALKVEFERAGGTATHNAKGKEGYTGKASTLFGTFVHQFFSDVETEDRLRRGLDEAIAFACWESRPRGRKPKVEAAALGRAKRIAELLAEAGVTNFSASS